MKRPFLIGLIFLSLLSTVGGFFWYREYVGIARTPITSWAEDHRADCAVILTGGVHRLREGLDLLSQKMVRKIIIAGTNPNSEIRTIFPEWPYYGNLNESDIVLEKHSQTTYGNARQSLALVEALKCRDIVLITDRTHMNRAYRTFRAVFPTDYSIQQRSVAADGYRPAFHRVAVEATKSMFYRALWIFF